MWSKTYSKSGVNLDRLQYDITRSNISIALENISMLGIEITINFKADLSNDEIMILDNLVANNSGQPLSPDPTLVTPTSPLNEHTMQPCGCNKGYFLSKPNHVCAITLSNKSQDGLTFSYNSNIDIEPSIGNYVFQNESSIRSWITAVDTVNHTITFELPVLNNGEGVYSKGYYVDVVIPSWKSAMYLWGATVTTIEKDMLGNIEPDPCSDFVELSVVDLNDLFLIDDVCQALFGVNAADASPYLIAMGFEQNGEYGHWTKYYDESWMMNINSTYTHSPDGAPGQIMAGLALRLSFFTTENEEHKYEIFTDYYLTAKD